MSREVLLAWYRRLARSRIAWHLLALGALSTYVFYVRRDALFWHLDGLSNRQLIDAEFRWLPFSAALGLDPYRGPGDLFSGTNFRLLPVFGVQALVTGAIGRVTTYVLYTCENLLLLWLLSRRLGLPTRVGIFAGWLLALLVTPLIWTKNTTLLFPLVPLGPQVFERMTFMVLLFVMFIEVGRLVPVASSLLIGGVVCVLLWLVAACPLQTVLVVPFLLVLSAVSLLVTDRTERLWKMSALLASAAALWLSGGFTYVHGLIAAGPVAFFSREIETYQSGLWWSSIAYQYDKFPAGTAVVAVSLASASILVARAVSEHDWSRLNCAAAVHCTLAIGMLVAWPIAERLPPLHELRHVRLFYFESTTFPLYALFCAIAVIAVLDHIPISRRRWPLYPEESLILAVVVPVVVAGAHNVARNNPYRAAVQPMAITRFLQEKVGLTAGSTFRGRVASLFPPMPGRRTASWDSMIADDTALYDRVGNDLRFVGLWAYDIPTLQEYSQIIDPGTYFWVTRAMSGADDTQDMRNHPLMTRLDVPLLGLLGTRFVISPIPIFDQPGLNPILLDHGQYLYEVKDGNVGQYFATQTVAVRDFPEMFGALHGTEDLSQRTFVFETVPSDLVRPNVEITMDRSAFHVKGKSDGTSLIVLPFVYSHCQQLSSIGKTNGARLIRVDLNLLGLLFTNEVDEIVAMSTGLLDRPGCLQSDTADFERLGLRKLARAIPRGGLVATSTANRRGGVPYTRRVLADKPVAYWRLDETSGRSAVDLANAIKGTIHGDVTLGQPGVTAGDEFAMLFGGVSSQVSAPDTPSLRMKNGDVTLEAWIKPTRVQAGEIFIVDKGTAGVQTEYGLVLVDGVPGYQGVAQAYLSDGGALTPGVWNHLAVTIEKNQTGRFYVNGVAAGTFVSPNNTAVTFSTQPLMIGNQAGLRANFSGVLGDVAIYPYPLTADQLARHLVSGSWAGVEPAAGLTLRTGAARLKVQRSWPLQ